MVAAPLLLVTTMIAWSAAIHTAVPIVKVGATGTDPASNLLAGLAGGAVGSSLTFVGVALLAPALRRLAPLLLTTAVGTVCGVLFWLGELKVVPPQALYVVWQPAVAYCIGLAMASKGRLAPLQATPARPAP